MNEFLNSNASAAKWIFSKAEKRDAFSVAGIDEIGKSWFWSGRLPFRMNGQLKKELGFDFAAGTKNGRIGELSFAITFDRKYKTDANNVRVTIVNWDHLAEVARAAGIDPETAETAPVENW